MHAYFVGPLELYLQISVLLGAFTCYVPICVVDQKVLIANIRDGKCKTFFDILRATHLLIVNRGGPLLITVEELGFIFAQSE